MFAHGLVFKLDDHLFLALYDLEGNIQEGESITDDEGVYDDLPPNAISFVTVEVCDVLNIKDLQTITVENEQFESEVALSNLIKEGGFPEVAKQIWLDWGA